MAATVYNGDKPYIFISYAHRDNDTVLPILESLTASGFRVWYDAGIEKGSHWNDNIADHLENCTVFIPIISKAFCESRYCQMELHHACATNKVPLPIYLYDVDLSAVSRGNNMWISQFQRIYYNKMPWEEFVKSLIANPLLAPCKDDKKTVIAKQPKSTPAESSANKILGLSDKSLEVLSQAGVILSFLVVIIASYYSIGWILCPVFALFAAFLLTLGYVKHSLKVSIFAALSLGAMIGFIFAVGTNTDSQIGMAFWMGIGMTAAAVVSRIWTEYATSTQKSVFLVILVILITVLINFVLYAVIPEAVWNKFEAWSEKMPRSLLTLILEALFE